MKRPRPTPPLDAPPGTVALGGAIEWFSVALQVSSETLDPEDVARLLGAPTESQRNGLPILRDDGSILRIPRFGRWSRKIKRAQTDEWDVSEVIRALFSDLPAAPAIWEEVAKLGSIRVSLGLSMTSESQDFAFDTDLIQLLANRRTSVWFDVYR